MPIISIPKSLREKLGEEGSEALAKMLNEQGKETEGSIIRTAELRFEKKLSEEISGLREENHEGRTSLREEMIESNASLRQEMVQMNTALRQEMVQMNTALREEMVQMNTALREEMVRGDTLLLKEIQKSKTDTIRWMFIFWIGQIGAVLGILFAVFK
jgi:dsDNA-specific endonuclease/ATPase MutS2